VLGDWAPPHFGQFAIAEPALFQIIDGLAADFGRIFGIPKFRIPFFEPLDLGLPIGFELLVLAQCLIGVVLQSHLLRISDNVGHVSEITFGFGVTLRVALGHHVQGKYQVLIRLHTPKFWISRENHAPNGVDRSVGMLKSLRNLGLVGLGALGDLCFYFPRQFREVIKSFFVNSLIKLFTEGLALGLKSRHKIRSLVF
jgi:hypothetical protein